MYVLALDIGTTLGWAFAEKIGPGLRGLTWGELVLTKRKGFEGSGAAALRLTMLLDEKKPAVVVVEEVRRHLGISAAHRYGGLVTAVAAWCQSQSPEVPMLGMHVQHIKKIATGKTGARKADMIAAAQRRFVHVKGENEADALWTLIAWSESERT